MRVSEFKFNLPEALIAQAPPAVRGSSRMLCMDRQNGALTDDRFSNLPCLLREGDLLVLNDSRVIPARLYATRAGLRAQHNSPEPSGKIEVLLTQQLSPRHMDGACTTRAQGACWRDTPLSRTICARAATPAS